MFSTVKGRGSRVESQKKAGRSSVYRLRFGLPQCPAPRPQPPRRGVLLLVVLSMLVLFMLVGTAFLMTSSQSDKASKGSAKNNRVGNYGTKLLDRALMEVLRDTDNVNSVVRYHSLLRDVYGTDGFQGVVYKPGVVDFTLADKSGQATRFSEATSAQLLGPTQGQFIDIYVRALGWDTVNNASLDDPLTPFPGTTPPPPANNEAAGATKLFFPDLRHMLKLERNVYSQPQLQTMPLTKGYYNGCLLTITTGPASGQSARILDYEFISEIQPSQTTPTNVSTRLFRFRVMAFQRSDGQPLQVDTSAARSPEIGDLAGATFIVNGRAYGGTGAGFNPLTTAAQPKLSAAEFFPLPNGDQYGAELALLPNSIYFNPLSPMIIGSAPGFAGPFGTLVPAASIPPTGIPKLNNPTPVLTLTTFYNYPTYVGLGGANESYDAADFQNMAIGLQTVTPRAQGRVVQSSGGPVPDTLSAMDPALDRTKFLRLDLEDVPLPSFHRPDLINFWNHRLLGLLTDPSGQFALGPDEAALAILDPYPGGVLRSGLNPQVAALIMAIKRQSSLRPLREDHPNFDGSNPMSVPGAISSATTGLALGIAPNLSLAVPYWQAVGPWDVDNDNDGIPDSIWVDLGDAVQEAEDGTRYKPLYAFLIIDLDSRLNVNAHGLADDVVPTVLDNTKNTFFDPTSTLPGWPGNLAHVSGAPLYSTLQLARGSGYGPAEISLRSVFRAPLDASLNPVYGNRDENLPANTNPVDSLAALMGGRFRQNGTTVDGKYGFNPIVSAVLGDSALAGKNYRHALRRPNWKDDPTTVADSPLWFTGEQTTPSLDAQLKFLDYPWSIIQRSAYGTPPDLKGRYALGLTYNGQPIYEVANDLNPNDSTKYFNLLAKSPYELDLSRAQRRDAWAVGVNSTIADTATAFNSSLNQNDDAPFSTTDLEKVLRAWDPESGTLPSRLWDVVNDFDPIKLLTYDPNRVVQASQIAFGSISQPELLTTAQQIASVSRRLVTTDSFSMPVASENFASKLPFGADGLPGVPGVDDDPDGPGPLVPDGVVDDASEIGSAPFANGCDDYTSVMAEVRARTGSTTFPPTVPTTPRITDYLRYRIILELLRTNMIASGMTDVQVETLMNSVVASGRLLAPDVISGLRMDLNRPLGDGKDNPHPFTNISDGVVDDPLEAGDPFLDINGNGKRDDGTVAPAIAEPFINLDGSVDGSGNATYTPPSDKLWQQLSPAAFGGNNTLAEPIEFDYTNGAAVPVHASVVTSLGQIAGGVRNLESQGRQLYARQLYCLMLMLVDENYIAPWDENDPQIMAWMDEQRNAVEKVLAAAPYNVPNVAPNYEAKSRADLIAKRKLTCRQIAQWAINCVDIRDSDLIMTPFEYDENPWDGWGVWDDNMTPTSTTPATIIPLDGDPATDENKAIVVDWANVPQTGGPKVLKQLLETPGSPAGPTNPPIVTNPLNQTRGIVWGAERPELLITETLAFHDRRTENLRSTDSAGGHDITQKSAAPPAPTAGSKYYPDEDLDQGLRPRGSAFVELYNPWSADGQYAPAELYSPLDVSTNYRYDPAKPALGVDLARLSNLAWDDTNGRLTTDKTDASKKIKRSPVWRMIVVNEWPDAKRLNSQDAKNEDRNDLEFPPLYNEPAAYKTGVQANLQKWLAAKNGAPPWRPTDPDFDPLFESDVLQMPGFYTKLYGPTFAALDKQKGKENKFRVTFPYVEREFYFTTDKSASKPDPNTGRYEWNFDNNRANFNLRIPDRSIKVGGPSTPVGTEPYAQTQRFVPLSLERSTLTDAVIAPIMPGHYGIVGSAGTNYAADPLKEVDNTVPQIYTTTIGRLQQSVGATGNADTPHGISVLAHKVRRIEMRPEKIPIDPATLQPNPALLKQQLLVGNNGGDPKDEIALGGTHDPYSKEIARENDLIVEAGGNIKNIYGADTTTANPTHDYYPPCVTIPVEGMNISEPPWGYGPREEEAAQEELKDRQSVGNNTKPNFKFKYTKDHKEGRYFRGAGTSASVDSYDKPFDTSQELLRSGTTVNYRVIHLQRLANPLLPWNPPPLLADGKTANPEHRANAPINPYLTVDSASTNLTVFNGTSVGEHDLQPDKQKTEGKIDPGNVVDITKYKTSFDANVQVFNFRSQERGYWSRLNLFGSNPLAPATISTLPQRVLWAQEPANVLLKMDGEMIDLIRGRQMSMRVEDEVPGSVLTTQNPSGFNNYINMVLKHSLGFGNESFGQLYDLKDTKVQRPFDAAAGAPAPGRFVFRHNVNTDGTIKTNPAPVQVNSTNPWLEWANRPFVSAEELLKVPAGSQATMLRIYSTIDPNLPAANRSNPYGLDALGTALAPVTNAIRFGVIQAPFGTFANVFAASNLPADVVRDPATSVPVLDANGNVQPYGAPHFYRILDYVQVPSRYVGTDTMLNAETFNDVPVNVSATEPVGTDISGPTDPRYNFQPPFNKVSRERDPGRVNLNTVTGRRIPPTSTAAAQVWSEVYDGIMHRVHDGNPSASQLGHFGPAWRDVVLSRRGYVELDAAGSIVDKPSLGSPPDTCQFGLNKFFPTFFANPFRSAEGGNYVPVAQMMQHGVDASLERVHPRNRGALYDANGIPTEYDSKWGTGTPPNFGDARDAGYGNDGISRRATGAVPNDTVTVGIPADVSQRDILPLFSEARGDTFADTDRNPSIMYQPMTRIGNLVTDRSGVFGIWITVGYFEVEPAPKVDFTLGDWGNPTVHARFGGDINLYNRTYPDGYMLGRELGSDTGDVKRPRGFYIIDRTEEVGFKPGEDLNVEKTIRLRRRIE